MNIFRLSLRLLWRDFRSGELTMLIPALLIAVSGSSTISLFADRMQRTFSLQAAEFLAADLAVATPNPLDAASLQKASELGLRQAQTVEFNSVLLEHDTTQLASVKAVSSHYPLRGHLKISDADYTNEVSVEHGPPPGEVWVEKRILSALQLNIGDSLTIGENPLHISQELVYEPDKRGNFYSFSPRVMMNQADLAATQVIQPGSRVQYVFQFTGDEQALVQYKDWLKPQLTPTQRLQDIHADRPELGSALTRAEQYLGLSSIVVVLIAGVAIAMTTRRYSERQFNATAVLRCFGLKQAEIVYLYGWQFLLLGAVTSLLGCVCGWLAQQVLFEILKAQLPGQLAQPGLWAYLLGFITGMAILLGFALPPLLSLQKVSPLRVLRRDLEPLPASGWLIYGLALGLVGALVWRYTSDLKMTAIILGGACLVLLSLSLIIYGLLKSARRLLGRLSLSWRFGLQGILRNPQAGISQILAFALTLTAMAISFVVRNDMLDNWQKQLPVQAPNHFVLNVLPDKVLAFQAYLRQADISSSRLYPVVRGRLAEINGEPVQARTEKNSEGEGAIQRELSLTSAVQLPEENKITAGWEWQAEQPGWVSVEQKLAESLHIQPGDELAFSIGNQTIKVSVRNIRHVDWDNMRPNFYMIFSSGTLDSFPSTYLTSFYLAKDQKAKLNGLVKAFPAISILEVDLILEQFKTILQQLTLAINLLLYFALAAGFAVLFAAVYATLDQRIYEGALMRVMGARVGFLRSTHVIEYLLLGGVAGVLAVVASEAILYGLDTQVLRMAYQPKVYLWLALPVIGAVMVCAAGYWGVRDVVRQAPLPVLRRL